jgi:hypothetical protein
MMVEFGRRNDRAEGREHGAVWIEERKCPQERI